MSEKLSRKEKKALKRAEVAARPVKRPSKVLVWLWYVPVAVVLGSGLFVSLQDSMTAQIVDKARTFQDNSAASNGLELLEERSYSLRINLDETFTLEGSGHKTAGDFRAGDKLYIPFDISGVPDYTLTNLHLEFVAPETNPLLVGINVGARACPLEWEKVNAKSFTCSDRNEVRVGSVPMAGSSFPVLNDGDKLRLGQTAHLLLEVKLAQDAILPLDGYEVELTAQLTGSRIPS